MVIGVDRAKMPLIKAEGAHFVLVEGRFYDALNDQLIEGARAAFHQAGASCEVVSVPGALEIPLAIARLAQAEPSRIAGYVALGVVIRGETSHYDIVANETTRALMNLGIEKRLALGNGVLTVETYDQAAYRADPQRGDKGGDAARAALSLFALRLGGRVSD